jgi:RHS repeat-associated protein
VSAIVKKCLLFLAVLFPALLLANNTPPVANATTHLNRWVIYPGEESLTLNGAASFDGDGWVDAYEWIVKLGPNTISSSGTRTSSTFTITLPPLSNPSSDQNVYTCSLRVRDNKGTWSSWKQFTLFQRHSVSIYYLTDHIGNVRASVDHKGNLVGYDDYDPYGQVLPGRSANIGDPKDMYKFTGHERDAEIGLDYMLARNYDPEIGRFMSVDPHHFNYPGISPFSYVLNNPLKYWDPTGRDTVYYSRDGKEAESRRKVAPGEDVIFVRNRNNDGDNKLDGNASTWHSFMTKIANGQIIFDSNMTGDGFLIRDDLAQWLLDGIGGTNRIVINSTNRQGDMGAHGSNPSRAVDIATINGSSLGSASWEWNSYWLQASFYRTKSASAGQLIGPMWMWNSDSQTRPGVLVASYIGTNLWRGHQNHLHLGVNPNR